MPLSAALKSSAPMQTRARAACDLTGGDALKRLIDDVQSGTTDFTTILVYDVSRWGRFQDADESAYYEYTCKRISDLNQDQYGLNVLFFLKL
jgi:DNA invertase Pin-like site-specific DNA recombinase